MTGAKKTRIENEKTKNRIGRRAQNRTETHLFIYFGDSQRHIMGEKKAFGFKGIRV
jgi:hypothetical protein